MGKLIKVDFHKKPTQTLQEFEQKMEAHRTAQIAKTASLMFLLTSVIIFIAVLPLIATKIMALF
jgi:hypothetical protein